MDYVTNTTLNNFSLIENQTIYRTGNGTTEEFTGLTYDEIIKMVIYHFCVPILCVFGIIGNILSVIMLGRDDVMRKTTRFLLQNVALADIGFLVSCIFVFTLDGFADRIVLNVYYITRPYTLPIASIFQMTTTYAVVIVTVDRYIAICHPLQSVKMSTMRNARWAVGITWCIAAIYNTPRFFEYHTKSYACEDSDGAIQMCYYEKLTSFGSTKVYRIVYETVLYFVVRVCTPLLILIICNVKLIKAVRSSRARHDVTHTHQKNTTVMLISIVIMFFICTFPITMYFLYINIFSNYDWYIAITLIYFADLLLVVNSAFNFVVYMTRSERFRNILLNLCKCKRTRVIYEI